MIGQTTLLASAFLVPLGMLLACLSPGVLNRMTSLLVFAPIPAAVAVLLVATDTSLTLAIFYPGVMTFDSKYLHEQERFGQQGEPDINRAGAP